MIEGVIEGYWACDFIFWDSVDSIISNLSSITALGNIFSHILRNRDFDADYIDKYRDQKAFSYFNSGFVGQMYIYELSAKKDILSAYWDVRASQSKHENKDLWILFRKKSKTNTDILSVWCSCMAGAYKACNNVVATLYKIEYANNKGWCSPSGTETACQCNQSTKKDIEPKRITKLFVSKSVRAKQEGTCAIRSKEARMNHLLQFDPKIGSHKEFCQKHFESFLEKFKKINQGTVIFKSFETDAADQKEISFMDANIQETCNNITSDNPNATKSELTKHSFKSLAK